MNKRSFCLSLLPSTILGLKRPLKYTYTACPRSLDPFYIATYHMGQDVRDIQYWLVNEIEKHNIVLECFCPAIWIDCFHTLWAKTMMNLILNISSGFVFIANKNILK